MNIAQLIEKLNKLAAALPEGLKSEVYAAECTGDDLGDVTSYVGVSEITNNEGDGVLLHGHPHLHNSPDTCPSFRRVSAVLVE